jgi:UDP-N-acetylmuramoyl-tripeptide--D-alanyl-D-alanine ligase
LGKILSDCAPSFVGVNKNCGKATLKNLAKTRTRYRYFVQEAGVTRPGDMARNISLLRPNIGIVTTIGKDHYTNFRTLDATAAEKGTLIESLPNSGTAVLNADDPHVLGMRQRTVARVLTYGLSEQADVRATEILSVWPERLSMTVTFQGESVRIETGLFGDLLTTSLLAAIAGALAAGVSLKQCETSLDGIESFLRRLSIHRSPQGSWIINDTCKAPFWGVERVISLMRDATAPRTTVVLGSFSDTGSGSASRKYRAMAQLGLDVADRVIFVGSNAAYIKKMITPQLEGRLFAFDSIKTACQLLAEDCMENELVLLKSSNNFYLERMIYGQKEEFKCWKETCEKKIHCEECKESGLK